MITKRGIFWTAACGSIPPWGLVFGMRGLAVQVISLAVQLIIYFTDK